MHITFENWRTFKSSVKHAMRESSRSFQCGRAYRRGLIPASHLSSFPVAVVYKSKNLNICGISRLTQVLVVSFLHQISCSWFALNQPQPSVFFLLFFFGLWNRWAILIGCDYFLRSFSTGQAPVVQRMDNAIQWINPYPVNSAVRFANTYLLVSDLSVG